MKNNNQSNGSVFLSVLAVAFIVMKIMGVINWSWLWVLSPIWIPLILVIIIVIIAIFID